MPLVRLHLGSTRALVLNVLPTVRKSELSHHRVLPHCMRLPERPIRDLRNARKHRVYAHLLRRRPRVRACRGCKVVYCRRSDGYSWAARHRKFPHHQIDWRVTTDRHLQCSFVDSTLFC
jgi:hypothetical protein